MLVWFTGNFGVFADILTVLSVFISFAIWLRLKNRECFDSALISTVLVDKDNKENYLIPPKVQRKHLTRAEVQGMLGVLAMAGESDDSSVNKPRYRLSYLNTPAFFDQLNDIQKNPALTRLEIECSASDIDQFDQEVFAMYRDKRV